MARPKELNQPMTVLNCQIEKSQMDQLKAIRLKTGKPTSFQVREALSKYLEDQGEEQ